MSVLDENEVAATFRGNANVISGDLISAFGLRFRQEVDHLSSPLDRWLDFRFRYVDPQPRPVVFSDQFPKANLPADAKAGLENLVQLIQEGGDINPYQGRGLILRNDTSGNKKDSRTDLLWADWGILHFHLTADPIPDDQFFSKAADYLAFCLVGGNVVAFIDILRHPDKEGFSEPKLIETVHRNWPDFLEQYALKGLSGEGVKSKEEIHLLRSSGVASFVALGGKVYMSPGMGVTSAATAAKITLVADRFHGYLRGLAQMVCDPSGQFLAEVARLGTQSPKFILAVTPAGLAVYDEVSRCAFKLPKGKPGEEGSFLNEIRNLLAPDWAVARLLSLPTSG